MDGRRHGGYSPFRRGFLLAEALALLLLFSLASAMAAPALWEWQEEQELEMAAETLASAVREVEIMAKNDTTTLGNAGEQYLFHCIPQADGTVAYRTEKGARLIRPRGTLPAGITCSGNLDLVFMKGRFAGAGKHYSIYLMTRDRKFMRQVVVSMYTGRVRVTKG